MAPLSAFTSPTGAMGSESALIIGSNVIGWAVLGGIAWNRLSAIEDRQQKHNELLTAQNSRIDKLEDWRAEKRGFREGYDTAKNKYADDDPNRKLQG